MAHADSAALNVATAHAGRPGDPCIMVIFGAAGDLTQPQADSRALQSGQEPICSPANSPSSGIAHDAMSTDDFRKKVSEDIKQYAGRRS